MNYKSALLFIAGAATAFAGTSLAQVAGFSVFPDVDGNSYYSSSVERMARTGIIKGYEDGRFGPNDNVTRAQLSVILDRYDQKYIEYIRQHLRNTSQEVNKVQNRSSAWCGDGFAEYGEECDDGNMVNGDGCSKECVQEVALGCGGHAVGASFTASDGCNTCTCTTQGAVCTQNACNKPCTSSTQCANEEACSSDWGSSPGSCVQRERIPSCGNGVCDANETAAFTTAAHLIQCVEDCSPRSTVSCGNGICESSETADSNDRYRRYCPSDCSYASSACESRKKVFNEIVQLYQKQECRTYRDCAIYEQSCPYLTCGIAINAQGLSRLEREGRDIVSLCRREGQPETCSSCAQQYVDCVSNKCVLKPGTRPGL